MPKQLNENLFRKDFRSLLGGMNTTDHPSAIPDEQAPLVQNYDLRDVSYAKKRHGSSIAATAMNATIGCLGLGELHQPGGAHNLLAAVGASLYRWDGAATAWDALTGGGTSGATRVTFVQARDPSDGSFNSYVISPDATAYVFDGDVALTAASAVPRGTGGFYWLERLWVYGNPTMPDLIMASSVVDPTNFNLNNSYRVGNGDPIKKALPYLNHGILVFLKHKIWMVDVDQTDIFQPTTLDDTQIVVINEEIGCVAPDSVVTAGRDVFFLSRYGVHSLLKTEQDRPKVEIDPLSRDIQETIDRINWQYVETASGVVWDNKYMLGVPLDSSQVPNYTLVYDLRQRSWSVYTGWEPISYLVSDVVNNVDQLYYADASVGRVIHALDEDVSSDLGSDIDGVLETKRHTYNLPANYKYWQYLEIAAEQLDGGSLTVEVQFDGDGWQSAGAAMGLTGTLITLPEDLPFVLTGDSTIRKKYFLDGFSASKNIQFRFTSDSTNRVVILWYSLHGYLDTESYD